MRSQKQQGKLTRADIRSQESFESSSKSVNSGGFFQESGGSNSTVEFEKVRATKANRFSAGRGLTVRILVNGWPTIALSRVGYGLFSGWLWMSRDK